LLVEVSVALASGRSNGSSALRDAATAYKVDTDAIALKVKQEFAAEEKAKRRLNQRLQARSRIAQQHRAQDDCGKRP
jgi:ParB family chromosome partitioning protein